MYQGSNKSALLSQKLISDAMLRLLEENPFNEISVSDLCREAQVSRQTFYSLFGAKENVILYELNHNCCFLPEESSATCHSAVFRSFCEDYSRYIIEKKHIISLLVRNDMIHFLYDVQYRSLMECKYFISDVSDENRIFIVDFIASGMNSIAKNFILTGGKADVGFLKKLMFSLFGGLYFKNCK
ncbi:MAG: TetR/AcrR family transcriptional regulator [Ruminococcus sp.]|uniref:TetR/AcrR family transcriptional regulator n=1 Tax=Ruminococcus sp. TaxID=41978 RepID=UPI001B1BC88E|nr:TetR/AcrR family transcriptional regulator [Ruminococcus sp.]MBO7474328.1 TetR/AcrR family transcriptional regulator [Ruminococcus sp.]